MLHPQPRDVIITTKQLDLMMHSPVCWWKTEAAVYNCPAVWRSFTGWGSPTDRRIDFCHPKSYYAQLNRTSLFTLWLLYFSGPQSADNIWHLHVRASCLETVLQVTGETVMFNVK